MIIIWAISNLQYIKFKACKGNFWILKNIDLTILEKILFKEQNPMFLIHKLFIVFCVQKNPITRKNIRSFKTKR